MLTLYITWQRRSKKMMAKKSCLIWQLLRNLGWKTGLEPATS
jgi:hypothetical protein